MLCCEDSTPGVDSIDSDGDTDKARVSLLTPNPHPQESVALIPSFLNRSLYDSLVSRTSDAAAEGHLV
jgi:hypothetical protein